MRPLTLLVAMLACGPAFAQEGPFSVVSSHPAPGDSSLALQTTLRFTFSAPLDTAARFTNGLPVAFLLPPLPIDSLYYSDDLTSLFLDVAHAVDTDYVWILTGAYSQAGERLCTPYALSYTTAPRPGGGVVAGYVSIIVPVEAPAKQAECWWPWLRVLPVLFDRPPGAGARVVAAATVEEGAEPSSLVFRLAQPRPATYWPVLLVDQDGDGEMRLAWELPWFERLEAASQDQDFDGREDSLVVTDTSRLPFDFVASVPGAAERGAELPGVARLEASYPNPFNPQTTVAFVLERPARLRLSVHDVLGREVAVLADGFFAPGSYEVPWHAAGQPSGVYLARLSGEAFTLARAMLLVK